MLPTIDRKQVANIQTIENNCTKIESVFIENVNFERWQKPLHQRIRGC